MAVNAVVDSLDGVPEALQGFYEQGEDGRFRLPLEGAETNDEIAGLKGALEKERRKAKDLEKRVRAIPQDFDPERDLTELAELRKERGERERRKAEEKGEWEKLREQLQSQHKGVLDRKDAETEALEKQLDSILRENAARQVLEDAGAHVDILLPHVLGQTRTVTENGGRKVIVVDPKGDRRLGEDGNDMTISELVKWMGGQDRYAPGFKGSDATGGGAKGRRAAGGGKHKSLKDMTEAEKIAFTEEHGLEAYQALVRETYGA